MTAPALRPALTRRVLFGAAAALGLSPLLAKAAMSQGNDDPDPTALARLRPGYPKEKLAAAAGAWWREPAPEEAGWVRYLDEHYRFTARLDRDGRVGSLAFDFDFDPQAPFAGLRMLMPEEEVVRAFPGLALSEARENYPYRFGSMPLETGGTLFVEIGHGRVTRMRADDPDAIYPERPLPLPRPALAFDVGIVPGFLRRGAAAPDGWCCGLPRGIAQAQWPLSNKTGFPLEHHFTVRVPEPYRAKGREFVALALFGDSAEESRRSPAISRLMNIIFDGRPLPATVEEPLRPFLDHLRNRHPMEFRAKDILYSSFAAIWLTQEEFEGEECEPPAPIRTGANAMCTPPAWPVTGAAERFFGWNGKEAFDPSRYLHRIAGGRPLAKWDILAFRITEVGDDPNTGRTPVDEFAADNPDGYVPRFSAAWDALGRDISYGPMHFGGTASPLQAMPDLTPFYIEFEETPGMFNFGGGSAQLDLVTMQLDWAQ